MGSILIFLSLIPRSVFAAQNLFINEFLPHPSSGNDWIEIYNPNDAEVSISGYKLNDSTSQIKEITESTIGPKCFLVLEVSNRLNNSGDSIYLYDKNGTQQDQQSYSTDPGVDTSWSRHPDGGSWQVSSALTKGGSNNSLNNCNQQSASITSQPVSIELNEFMPNPSDGNEWVELRNKNNYASDISGYQVDDIDGGSSPFTLLAGSIIPASGYWVLDLSSAKFNNDTDSIRLLNSSGNVLESFDYSSSSPGVSYAKDSSGSWKQTTTPTKADQNQITSPAAVDTSSKTTSSNEPSTPKAASYPTPKQTPVVSQVLGSRLVEATPSTDEGSVRNFTYSLDKVEATKDAAKTESPNSPYPIGLIVIFWGVVVLLVVSIILSRRGFFDKIKLR